MLIIHDVNASVQQDVNTVVDYPRFEYLCTAGCEYCFLLSIVPRSRITRGQGVPVILINSYAYRGHSYVHLAHNVYRNNNNNNKHAYAGIAVIVLL